MTKIEREYYALIDLLIIQLDIKDYSINGVRKAIHDCYPGWLVRKIEADIKRLQR